MFWSIYFVASVLSSAFLAFTFKKYTLEIFLLLLVIFMTPAQIEIQSPQYGPSLFTFIFNIVFERNFSFRPLRPLSIVLPLAVFLISVYLVIKRKFF